MYFYVHLIQPSTILSVNCYFILKTSAGNERLSSLGASTTYSEFPALVAYYTVIVLAMKKKCIIICKPDYREAWFLQFCLQNLQFSVNNVRQRQDNLKLR